MEEQIKLIAERLKGLREIFKLSADDIAQACNISLEKYLEYETGDVDIPVSILYKIAQKFGIDLTILLTGEEPHMHRYSLVRNGQGIKVERRKEYQYQALAYSFADRKFEPFLVVVEPKCENNGTSLMLNTHVGQEFNYILEGRMKFYLEGKEIILNEHDSIYFDSSIPHGMIALDGKPCKFLAIVI